MNNHAQSGYMQSYGFYVSLAQLPTSTEGQETHLESSSSSSRKHATGGEAGRQAGRQADLRCLQYRSSLYTCPLLLLPPLPLLLFPRKPRQVLFLPPLEPLQLVSRLERLHLCGMQMSAGLFLSKIQLNTGLFWRADLQATYPPPPSLVAPAPASSVVKPRHHVEQDL